MIYPEAAGTRMHQIVGTALPLHGDDIDTDQILPARFLTAISFQGMEEHLFVDARNEARLAGTTHSFSERRFERSSILLVNRNFGCGSSREHAPQGLRRWGIEAIVGQSFGEIFAGNCTAIGMPCIEVPASVAETLLALVEKNPATSVAIDLLELSIRVAGSTFPVALSPGRRRQLIEGSWDAMAVLLAASEQIDAKMQVLGYDDLTPTSRAEVHSGGSGAGNPVSSRHL